MTEYEFHDFLTNAQTAAGQAAMDVVAVFFAFVVCVYVVGSRLKRVEAIAVCLVYTVFLYMPTLAVRDTVLRIRHVVEQHPNYMLPNTTPEAIGVVALAVPGVLLAAWLLSIFYLIAERRKPSG